MDKFVKRTAEKAFPVTEVESDSAPNNKKKRHIQRFRKEYSEKHSFIRPSPRGETFAFCNLCQTHLSIESGGYNDINKHILTKKHTTAAKSSESTTSMSNFFAKESDDSVIKSEVLFTTFLIEGNISLANSDRFNARVKEMFPDSQIAKKYACGRTKTTAIVHTLARESSSALAKDMKVLSYSLATDGSNDKSFQLYPIVVRIYDSESGHVSTKLLSCPELKSASTASGITELLIDQLKKYDIPIENCLSFMSDNAAVMTGKKSGVSTRLKEKNPNMLNIGCICHLLNLAVKKASKTLPCNVEEVLIDIYYFFNHSHKRQSEFNFIQELECGQIKKFLKYCPTRWLELSTCLQRLVDLWKPLTTYFEKINADLGEKERKKIERQKKAKEVAGPGDDIIESWFSTSATASSSSSKDPESGKGDRLDRIVTFLNSRRSLIYCSFLLWIMPTFDKVNRQFQQEAPQVHLTKDALQNLARDIMSRFIKPEVLRRYKDAYQISYADPTNHLPSNAMYFGSAANALLVKLKDKARLVVVEHLKSFYVKALGYMKENFPLADPLYQHARILNMSCRESVTFTDLQFFLKKIPMTCSLDIYEEQFRKYQIMDLPTEVINSTRVDKKWHFLKTYKNPVNDEVELNHLATAMLAVCCIPHSNADAERIFSIVKKNYNDSRASMKVDTLSNLLVNKINYSANLQLSKELLDKCKKATRDMLEN